MNRLTNKDRARILHLLCEGQSTRAVTRLTGASKNTVAKLLVDAGKACAAYHDEHVRGLTSKRVQVDEIWSFTYAKQKNVAGAKKAPEGAGDTWTWTAIDADTKLIASYLVGGRDGEYALAFMDDLASRLANRVQLTSDGHRAYLEAVEGAFGCDIDYAILNKIYGTVPEATKGRYSPAVCLGAKKERIEGNPDRDHVSTSYVERSNLTMRMHMRRFTRLTNAFSKKVDNHAYAVALHMMYYNFVRIHKTLRVTPAMAAGVTTKLWGIGDIAKLVEVPKSQLANEGRTKNACRLAFVVAAAFLIGGCKGSSTTTVSDLCGKFDRERTPFDPKWPSYMQLYSAALDCAHHKAAELASGSDGADVIAAHVRDVCVADAKLNAKIGQPAVPKEHVEDLDLPRNLKNEAETEVLQDRAGHCPPPQ